VPLSEGRFLSAGPAPFLDAIVSSERRPHPTISNGQEPAGQKSDISPPHPHQGIIYRPWMENPKDQPGNAHAL
jgi:hypothetical protein